MKSIKEYMRNMRFYKFLSHCKNHRKAEMRNSFFRAEGQEILHEFTKCLNEQNIVFWLDYGTLLGYFRDHDFINHDFDLDFGAMLEDQASIRDTLLKAGFTLIKEYHVKDSEGIEECYRWGHTSLDVFYYQRIPSSSTMYCYSFRHFNSIKARDIGKVVPVGVQIVTVPFDGFEKVKFKECDVYIPRNVEDYLIANYGFDYMIPNPKFNWMKDASNITVFSYEEKPGWAVFYDVL